VHLVSSEAYVVVGGRGVVQTLDGSGYLETELSPGAIVTFGSGTIHRLVNKGDLDIVAIMQNAGLPESGDAVMTFPPHILSNPDSYRSAAVLPSESPDAETIEAVTSRRSLALSGWEALVESSERGDPEPLLNFYRSAQALVRASVPGWRAIVDGPASAQVERALANLVAIGEGDPAPLRTRTLNKASPDGAIPSWGMCGRLTTWRGR
jgi:hypothetical protein